MNDDFYNHRIILIERAETSGSGESGNKYPMWRCQLEGGKKVNFFKHTKPERNSYGLFHEYHDELDAMETGDVMTWNQHPIEVRCAPDGQWLKVVTVKPRPDGAKPDEDVDNSEQQMIARAGVQLWAAEFLADKGTRILDIETSDKTNTSEILSIAVTDGSGRTIFESLIRPAAEYTNKAEHVNGLTADRLKDAPTLAQVYSYICAALQGMIVGIYNADFDEKCLQNALIRAGLPPVAMLATVCVMEKYAMYRADWNFVKQDWRWATLSEAAARFGIETPEAHGALPDCKTTLAVIEAMAAGAPLGEVEPF
jgi:DNA polymerase-3 subunit epsilon